MSMVIISDDDGQAYTINSLVGDARLELKLNNTVDAHLDCLGSFDIMRKWVSLIERSEVWIIHKAVGVSKSVV